MDGSEREIHVEERAYQTLGDERAVTAYASFVEAQLRYRRVRSMLTWLRTLTGGTMVVTLAVLSAGLLFAPVAAPARATGPVTGRGQ
jgi:hypothetical protein